MKIVINIKRKACLKEVKNVKEIRKGFENAIDFLMFSYFGISLEDGEDREQILDAAVKRAYIDATQQGSYNAMLKGKNKDASKEIKDKAIQRLKEAVDELLSNKVLAESYSAWHQKMCKEICMLYEGVIFINKKENEEKAFSYGNAQKWVNMTMKYIYILHAVYKEKAAKCDFCNTYGDQIDILMCDLDVPVDSYILKSASKKYKDCEKAYGFDMEIPNREMIVRNGKEVELPAKGPYSDEKTKPWSKWSKEEYDDFQKELKKRIKDKFPGTFPIEWEGSAWIEIAKKRK